MRTLLAVVCSLLCVSASSAQDGASVQLPDIVVTEQEEYAVPLPRGMDIGTLSENSPAVSQSPAGLRPKPPQRPRTPGRPPSPDFQVPVRTPSPVVRLTAAAALDARVGLGLAVASANRSVSAVGAVTYRGAREEPSGMDIRAAVSYAGVSLLPPAVHGRLRLSVDATGVTAGAGAGAAAWKVPERGLNVGGNFAFTAGQGGGEAGIGLSGRRRVDLPPLQLEVGVPAAVLHRHGGRFAAAGGLSALAGGRVGEHGLRLSLGASAIAGIPAFPVVPELSMSVDHSEDWTSWARGGHRLHGPHSAADAGLRSGYESPGVARGLEVGSSRTGQKLGWRISGSASEIYPLSSPGEPWVEGRISGEVRRSEPLSLRSEAVATVGNPPGVEGMGWGVGLATSVSLAFINLPVDGILEAHWSRGFELHSWVPESARLCPWLPDSATWSISMGVGAQPAWWCGVSLLGGDGRVGAQCALAIAW